MTAQTSKEELIAALEGAVQETLSFFDGPGRTSRARIDQWGAWEVLAHLPYWHYATAWGITTAAAGGPPWQLSAGADETNAACLKLHAGEDFGALLGQLRRAQERLVRAAREAPDLDAAAFRRPDGTTLSVRQRLETIAGHWRSHFQALNEAGA